MTMYTFLEPSTFKIKVFLGLALYVIISTLFLTSYNTARNLSHRELGTFDKVGLLIAYPSVFLSMPGLYVEQNSFTTETDLDSLMADTGCTNCSSDEFNQPIKTFSSLGIAAGLIVEILFLYIVACTISSLTRLK